MREWVRVDGKSSVSVAADGRGFLLDDIWPGEVVDLVVPVVAPLLPGNYIDRINLVSELVQWFPQGNVDVKIKVAPLD